MGILASGKEIRPVSQSGHVHGIHRNLGLSHDVDGKMGEVEVLQGHGADLIRLRVFCVWIPGFRDDGLPEDILPVKEHLKRTLHLIQGPGALVIGGEQGNQDIGIMLDFIQIIPVLIIIVGAFVVIQLSLQICLHGGVGFFCSQHVFICAGESGSASRSTCSCHKDGLRRQGGHDKAHKNCKHNHHNGTFPVPPEKPGDCSGFLGSLLRGLPGVFCCLLNGPACLFCSPGGGILLLYGLLLKLSGAGIADTWDTLDGTCIRHRGSVHNPFSAATVHQKPSSSPGSTLNCPGTVNPGIILVGFLKPFIKSVGNSVSRKVQYGVG